MISQEIQNYVNQAIKSAQKNALYDITNASYHTHNGIDSPKLNSSSPASTSSINGMAYASSNTTVPTSGIDAQVLANTSIFVNGITFDATNHQFIVKTAGQYLIIGNANYVSTVSGKEYAVEIGINADPSNPGGFNPQAKTYTQASMNSGSAGQPVVTIQNLNIGDTIQLWTWNNSGSSAQVYSGSALTYLSVAKV
jgi:hypothetical protein